MIHRFVDLVAQAGIFAYQRDYNSYQQIWKVSQSPGGDPTQVTSQTTTTDSDPDVSPDGSQIAFLRFNLGDSDMNLMICDADGSNLATLDNGNCNAPMWHPDGSKILYRIGSGFFTIEPDGSNKTATNPTGGTPPTDPLLHPTWNSDGTKIAFHVSKASSLVADELWVMDADGTNHAKLSNATFGGLGGLGIAWAHGSDVIAFVERISSVNHVSKINADGTGKTQLTSSGISPAMSKYAWTSDDASIIVPEANAAPWTIFAVSAAGGQAALSPTLNASANVAEGIARLAGGRIYVVRNSTWDLVSVAEDGSGLRVEDDINPGDFSVLVEMNGNGTEL